MVMVADSAAIQTNDSPPAERWGTLQPEPGGVVSKSKASRPGSADDWASPRQASARSKRTLKPAKVVRSTVFRAVTVTPS
jgi:hypothetical protein